MAATDAATRLTESHQRAQSRIGARTVLAMRRIWPLLDPDDLDGSFTRWFTAAHPIIGGQRAASARLAANYVATFKALEIGTASVPFTLADVLAADQLATSLLVTGPIHVKRALIRGVPIGDAMRVAQGESAGAALRHTLDGGRGTTIDTIQADDQALGWARKTTSAKPCAFCALMASRGPVYKSQESSSFKPHDRCKCQPEPIYREDAEWPGKARQWGDLYTRATADGGDPLNAFRRAYERAA